MNRSRYRMKKTSRRSPSGKRMQITKNSKPKAAACALCKGALQGVPRKDVISMSKLSKTQRRPERRFGGVLCGGCAQRVVKARTRLQAGISEEKKVPLDLLRYVKMLKG